MSAFGVALCFPLLRRVSVKRAPAELTCTILLHTFLSSRVVMAIACDRSVLSCWPVASSNTCVKGAKTRTKEPRPGCPRDPVPTSKLSAGRHGYEEQQEVF